MAPVIMTVCRNVHANTPYFIWNSIMDKVFKLKTKVREYAHRASILWAPSPLNKRTQVYRVRLFQKWPDDWRKKVDAGLLRTE